MTDILALDIWVAVLKGSDGYIAIEFGGDGYNTPDERWALAEYLFEEDIAAGDVLVAVLDDSLIGPRYRADHGHPDYVPSVVMVAT